MTMTLRYRVVTQVPPQLRDRGFVAYVEDAEHPDGAPCSMSWHLSTNDADRVANAMNRLALADFRPERTRADMLKPL